MGVSDDVSLSALSADDVLNLRRSTQFSVFRDKVLRWSPIDANKWYYINADPTTSDARFTTPADFAIVSDVNLQIAEASSTAVTWTCGTVDIEYVIEFDGATIVPV
jgi:hypothetical protein